MASIMNNLRGMDNQSSLSKELGELKIKKGGQALGFNAPERQGTRKLQAS